jgi:hypothetical protein
MLTRLLIEPRAAAKPHFVGLAALPLLPDGNILASKPDGLI